jgi:prepilin-type N-terminal cleavage/methylation domain-containing protein
MTTNIKKGFTLIELLIVIVIIGILAAAVLAAINPIEQINKSQDTQTRANAREILNAAERYYTSVQQYPWDVTAASDTPAAPGGTGQDPTGTDWLQELEDNNELKQEFQNRDLSGLLVFLDSTEQLVRVCFAPASQAELETAAYDSGGELNATATHVCIP